MLNEEELGKGSKARLPPKRGQVKVGIFRMVVKKVAGIASTAGLGRVADEPASGSPPELSTYSRAKQE